MFVDQPYVGSNPKATQSLVGGSIDALLQLECIQIQLVTAIKSTMDASWAIQPQFMGLNVGFASRRQRLAMILDPRLIAAALRPVASTNLTTLIAFATITGRLH